MLKIYFTNIIYESFDDHDESMSPSMNDGIELGEGDEEGAEVMGTDNSSDVDAANKIAGKQIIPQKMG